MSDTVIRAEFRLKPEESALSELLFALLEDTVHAIRRGKVSITQEEPETAKSKEGM